MARNKNATKKQQLYRNKQQKKHLQINCKCLIFQRFNIYLFIDISTAQN